MVYYVLQLKWKWKAKLEWNEYNRTENHCTVWQQFACTCKYRTKKFVQTFRLLNANEQNNQNARVQWTYSKEMHKSKGENPVALHAWDWLFAWFLQSEWMTKSMNPPIFRKFLVFLMHESISILSFQSQCRLRKGKCKRNMLRVTCSYYLRSWKWKSKYGA